MDYNIAIKKMDNCAQTDVTEEKANGSNCQRIGEGN